MSKFKVGQKVKLNPETKPYTFTSVKGGFREKLDTLLENKTYEISKIGDDGDVWLVYENGVTGIHPKHLLVLEEPIHSNKDIELRKFIVSELGIEHADRFQEVYEWITGEK